MEVLLKKEATYFFRSRPYDFFGGAGGGGGGGGFGELNFI